MKLEHEILIEAPVEAVWAALADLEAVAAYNPGVERAQYTSRERAGVGAARLCNFRSGGSVRETVVEWQPGAAITIEMSDHPWPMSGAKFRIALSPEGTGTRMRQLTEYVFTGDAAMADAVREQWDQGVSAVTGAFKRYVEKEA